MTPEEKQIIRSTIHTLIELTYKLMKEKQGITEAQISELEGYENTLKDLINRLQ